VSNLSTDSIRNQVFPQKGGLFGSYPGEPSYLGKLGFKEEAAGKVRVFAMVDCFTQWLMRPLHRLIMAVLRYIPQDGTYDQLAPVRKLLRSRKGAFWSFDLSAATDRLPVEIQRWLLSPALGELADS
jgi:hypothetical protein